MSRRSQHRESQTREQGRRIREYELISALRMIALAGTGTRLARMPFLSGMSIGEQLLGRPSLFR